MLVGNKGLVSTKNEMSSQIARVYTSDVYIQRRERDFLFGGGDDTGDAEVCLFEDLADDAEVFRLRVWLG